MTMSLLFDDGTSRLLNQSTFNSVSVVTDQHLTGEAVNLCRFDEVLGPIASPAMTCHGRSFDGSWDGQNSPPAAGTMQGSLQMDTLVDVWGDAIASPNRRKNATARERNGVGVRIGNKSD